MAVVLFSDTVFWVDTIVRLVLDGLLLGLTLRALYLWRNRIVPRQNLYRFGLLLSGRVLNMIDSIDFYGVKVFPPELSLFTVALQTGGDILCGSMFALAYFTVMLNTAKFNRTVKMAVPHAARVIMLSLACIYNVGYMICVIVALATHSPSPALGAQRVLTGLCTSGICACAIYIIAKVIILIDTEGAVHARKKFVRILFILVPASFAMLIQQVQSALAFFGPFEYQSAANYIPNNNSTRRIDSYNLFAVIADRQLINLSDVEYDFSWYFASLLRLVYVPIFIYAAYPTSGGPRKSTDSNPTPSATNSKGEVTAPTPKGKRESLIIGASKANNVSTTKQALLDGSMEMSGRPSRPTVTPSVVIPEHDSIAITTSDYPRPSASPRPNGSPRPSDAMPADVQPSRKSSFLEAPEHNNERGSERYSGELPRRSSDLQRKSNDGIQKISERKSGNDDGGAEDHQGASPAGPRIRSISSPKSLISGILSSPNSRNKGIAPSSPRNRQASTHTRSAEPSPRQSKQPTSPSHSRPTSPSHSRHILPGSSHTSHVLLVDEDEEEEEEEHKESPKEPVERKPVNKPKEGFQLLNDDFVEVAPTEGDKRDVEEI